LRINFDFQQMRAIRNCSNRCRIHEAETEATAFVVSNAIGLETDSASSDYIQLWNGDTHLRTESLARVRQAASLMLTALNDA
jgi:hypothetical protein